MRQADGLLILMTPLLQSLPDKGNVTFNNDNKGKRLLLFNFSRAAILDFVTSLRLLLLLEVEVLFYTIGQRNDIIEQEF